MARAAKRSRAPFIEVRESPIAGMGVFAVRRIPAGTRVVEYAGERIPSEEADRRYDDDAMESHHTFLFAVGDEVIDAAVDGNDARFINHSCAPNCEAVEDGGRIYIHAIDDIPAGTELVYDYGLTREEPWQAKWAELYRCRCGAPKCRGTILKSPLPPAPKKRKTAATKAKKRAAPRRAQAAD